MSWIIGVSIAVAVLAFVVLVVFLCIALFSVQKTLIDLQSKIHSFDPLFRALSDVGGSVEKRVSRATEEIEARESTQANLITDALQLAVLGVTLWQKIKEKR